MAALVAQFQHHLVRIRRRCQMLRCRQAVVIDLDIAEKLIVLLLARGQIERTESNGRIGAFRLDPIAIQVIVVGDLEIELDRAAIHR